MCARVLQVLVLLVIFSFVLCYEGIISGDRIIQIIKEDGYEAEVHVVLTPDAYMLELHRIPYRRNAKGGITDRPVVFLMHGLLGASFNFIYLGPEYSIAYNLADAGFDVWMGNARGTRNSRKHFVLNLTDEISTKQFFDFSWEEIALHDISSSIDFIINYTKQSRIHYIGHSQGGTVFLVLNSMLTEYNAKISSAHLLAGVGFMEHFPNKLLSGLAMFTNTIYSMATRMGIVELFPPPRINGTLASSSDALPERNGQERQFKGENFDFNCYPDEMCKPSEVCTGNISQKEMCELFGIEEIVSEKILDNMGIDIELGGAALKQFAHYGQNIQDQAFRRWNYGPKDNFQKYGSPAPPAYNISRIDVQTTMYYTVNDNLLDERDVLKMCLDMPRCDIRRIARDSFLHVDFIAAGDVKELVTDHIIDDIWNVHNNNPPNRPDTNGDGDGSGGDDSDGGNAGTILTISNFINVTIFCNLIYYLTTYYSV